MLNCLVRLFLTANATSWLVVLYEIKEGCSIIYGRMITGIVLILIPILFSFLSILLIKVLGHDSIDECKECQLADQEFLPVYLGYFFVALSIPDTTTLVFISCIVFVFTYLTQAQYFNPLFLLFGYHFYRIKTHNGTNVLIVAKGRIIRNPTAAFFSDLRRLNDTTYIARRDRET